MTAEAPLLSTGWHVAEWIETFVRQTKDRWAGKPLKLEPWQRAFIDELFAVDEHGNRIYNEALLGIPKKNGKSTLVAGLGLYLLANTPGAPEVLVAAGSGDQAGVVFGQVKASVEQSPDLRRFMGPGKTVITCPENHGTLLRITTGSTHGPSPSAIITDELHEWDKPRHRDLYESLTNAQGARTDAMLVHITTAGYDKDTLLGETYDRALEAAKPEKRDKLTIVRDRESGFLLWWYALDPEDDWTDEKVVKRANPASWITEAELRRQRNKPSMRPGAYQRFRGNRWTDAKEAYIPKERWSACRDDSIEIPPGARVHVGADAAIVSDTSSVAWAHRLEDGRVALRSRVWSVDDRAKAHVHLGADRFRLGLIDEFVISNLAGAVNGYSIADFTYDKQFLEEVSERLSDQGLDVVEMPQGGAAMARAYQRFYVAAKEGRIVHDGDPVLAAHVAAADAKQTQAGYKIDKRTRVRKIDGLVAAVMAHESCYLAAETAEPWAGAW